MLRCALHIFSGKNFLNFAFVALCGALQTHFHGRGRNGKRHLQRRFLRKHGAAGERVLALSVTAYAVPPLPKGEARALPGTFSLHLKLQQRTLDLGSPGGRAGAGAPERVAVPFGELSPQATEEVNPAPCLQIKFASFLRFTAIFSNLAGM